MYNLPGLTIRTISVSETNNNVYILTSKTSGAQVLIDAADDAPAILSLLADAQEDTDATTHVSAIITTHSHWDHVRALGEVKEVTKAPTAAGEDEIEAITVPTDIALGHGEVRSFEDIELEVIQLRGHTLGSIALLYRDPRGPAHLFSGDSLFPGGVGNTEDDPDRFLSLITDVTERIFDQLPDSTVVHPGHGNGTTLGAERPHLAQWKARGW
ncbi:MBL fold metallo-hydrolase [Dietzia lutea]|uniref:Zn-dependent hydrolase n=1 Tax=Dietzia lutea TaxID=546160 RepID=A0A2S1R3R0_9ACTN|nr:MBL fold metallo-hydrolase [Dietzia lutea]AWH90917.1 Zn-dependent hydrolase [Dietzia lutea]